MLAWCQLLISSSTDFKSPSTSVLVAPSSECSRGLAGAVDQPLCAVCSSSLAVLCPSVYSAVLRGGQSVPPCVTDVSTVLIARYVNSYINEYIIIFYFFRNYELCSRNTYQRLRAVILLADKFSVYSVAYTDFPSDKLYDIRTQRRPMRR